MKFPNLRYGNPVEFAYYAQGIPLQDVAKRLRRSERCISNWLKGTHKIPYWVPELVRLQNMEHAEMMRQMGIRKEMTPLGIIMPTGTIYQSQQSE